MSKSAHSTFINGRYELKTELGSGGMGTVFLAEDTVLKRLVAVKRCNFHLPEARKLFSAEARAQAKLLHPNIVTIFDFGYDFDGAAFIVMEYFDGRSVQDLIHRSGGKLPLDRALEISRATAQALSVAHAGKVIHRDIKPGNLLIGHDGTVKLSDFGLASAARVDRAANFGLVGTSGFAAPEASNPEGMDAQSDVYSLGMTLVSMLFGDPSYILDVAKSELPGSVKVCIERATRHDRDGRCRDMKDFLARLPPSQLSDCVGTPDAIKFARDRHYLLCAKSSHNDFVYDLADERPNKDKEFRLIEGYAFDPKRGCAVYVVRKGEDGQLIDKRAFKAKDDYGELVSCNQNVLQALVTKAQIIAVYGSSNCFFQGENNPIGGGA